MINTGIYFGTTTGNTEIVAELIAEQLKNAVTFKSIDEIDPQDFFEFDLLFLGISTWNIGELESTWDDFFPNLDSIDFTGKVIAIFGLGDQINYGDSFLDAMGILFDKLVDRGATIIGYWPIDDYQFDESFAVRDDRFVGLAIDMDNQDELTEGRVSTWVTQVLQEFHQLIPAIST